MLKWFSTIFSLGAPVDAKAYEKIRKYVMPCLKISNRSNFRASCVYGYMYA